MAKRKKRVKRVFPKRFASDNIQERSRVKWGQAPLKHGSRGLEYVTLERPSTTTFDLETGHAHKPVHPIPEEKLATHSRVYVENKAFAGIPRAQVLMKLWQGTMRQGMEHIHHISLLDGATLKLGLYFHGQSFFFIERDFRKSRVRHSIVYPDRDYALYAFRNERIVWSSKVYEMEDSPS